MNRPKSLFKQSVFAGAIALGAMATSTAALADRVEVKIENLTSAIYFTPVLAVAHSAKVDLFSTGEPASAGIQAIAEGGDVAGAKAAAEGAGAATAVAPDLLAPGKSVTLTLNTNRYQNYLSIAGMLLPTNDGFVGLDSTRIPRAWYRKTVTADGYDAGTERNDEVVNGGGAPGVPGIPADPGHIHRGTLGDRDLSGGDSDLDSAVHRWLNPVARVTITHYGYRRNSGKK